MSRRIIVEWVVRITNVGFFCCSLWSVRGDNAFKRERLETRQLTETEISCCSVAVQFSSQFVIFAFHSNPFRVEVSGVSEFSFIKFVITFVLVNFRYCWKGEIKSIDHREKKKRRKGLCAKATKPPLLGLMRFGSRGPREEMKDSPLFSKRNVRMRILFLSRRFPPVRLGYVTETNWRRRPGKRRTCAIAAVFVT